MSISGMLDREVRPMLEARDAVSTDLDGLLARFGAVFLRGYLDAHAVSALRWVGEMIFAEREERYVRGELNEKQTREHLRGSITYRELNERFPAEANSLCLPIFLDLGRNYLGREPVPSHITALRRVVPSDTTTALPFHQDQTVTQKRSVNLWTALTPCGVAAPGLEVVLTDSKELIETMTVESQFATDRVQIDAGLVTRRFGPEALWHPEFQPGDSVIFMGTTIHRTHLTSDMAEPRLDAEMRLM